MLPALSSQQDDKQIVKRMVRRAIITSSFLVFPPDGWTSTCCGTIGYPAIDREMAALCSFLQIFCAVFALMPIHTANLQAINALGRSDVFLKLEIIKNIVGLIILGLTIFYGAYAIAVGMLVTGVIGTFINTFPNSKLLNYSYRC